MTIETKQVMVPICRQVEENGEIYLEETGEFVETTVTDIYADEGKVFRHIPTDKVLGNCTHITIGTEDSVENYEEVDVVGGGVDD